MAPCHSYAQLSCYHTSISYQLHCRHSLLWCVLQNVRLSEIVVSFFTFLILYNNLVPISLYVSLDMIKVSYRVIDCVCGLLVRYRGSETTMHIV
jgi:hypothetical protein